MAKDRKHQHHIDQWMDDEAPAPGAKGGRKARQQKSASGKAVFLAPEEANAVVSEVYPNQCRVLPDEAPAGLPREFLCSYRRSGVVAQGEAGERERTPVAVGDRVRVSRSSPDSGVVEGVCERRNRLVRPAPGRESGKVFHVLAANVDRVVIVASPREPEFSPGLVDRFLVAAQAAGIEPLVCVTKADLLEGSDRPWRVYSDLGWEVHEVSSLSGAGIAALRDRLRGSTAVFCGRSGAGKTSLLRGLLGSEVGKVGEVSQATGKGKHTTTSAVLLGGAEGSRWIDTPGVREFGLVGVEPEGLAALYPEFAGLECSGRGCGHSGEEGCQAVGLARHSSYLRILESLRSGEN